MKSFLLVTTRPEDEAIKAEYRSFCKVTGLGDGELEQVRIDMLGLPEIDVERYSGIIVAGSSYGTTTPDDRKTPTQKRTETELSHLITDIVAARTPCLTAGYGTEIATVLLGGTVTTCWGEEPQIAEIMLTQDALDDPIFDSFPRSFLTYVNHREAIEELPEGAVKLAKSITCPVQMMRITDNFYATQFNPELDSDAIRQTLERYEDAGYPGTDDVDSLVTIGRLSEGRHQAGKIVANFVRLFRE